MKALLIVDVQNDFLPGGALGVNEGDQVIPVIEKIHSKFPLVVASKDWHPSKHSSFATTHGKQMGEVIQWNGMDQILWPDHCVQGERGADFAEGLKEEWIDHIVLKGTDLDIDSYSTFFDNGQLRSTGLSDYLKKKGVSELYILGLATDYCVKYSTLDAISEGFTVYVIEDGCRGVNLTPGDSERALEEMSDAGASVIHSSEI